MEIVRVGEQTARDLTLINSRLHNGNTASGFDVWELVSVVGQTAADHHRFSRLASISNGGDWRPPSEAFTNFPLTTRSSKQRCMRNSTLTWCFQQLDFTSHIPLTCDPMRDQLNSCASSTRRPFAILRARGAADSVGGDRSRHTDQDGASEHGSL